MTAVTQCPQCGTRFRVVPDQLKISQGWVRCGKCAEVFNARQAIESATALKPRPAAHASAVAPQQVSIVLRQQERVVPPADAGAQAAVAAPREDPVEASQPDVAPIEPHEAVPRPSGTSGALPDVAVSTLQQTLAGWVRAPDPEAKAELAEPVTGIATAYAVAAQATPDAAPLSHIDRLTEGFPVETPAALSDEPTHVVPPPAPDEAVVAEALQPQPQPQADVGFIRQARRQAAWSSGPARAALVALVMLASSLLALQVTVHERDRLAVMLPGLKPWLIQLCEPMGCEISPLRRIEAVEIVSTELVRAKDGSYRFEMGLRNQAALPVAMPAVELSLTDRNGEAVLRRVLLPDDWVLAPGELPAASETNLTLKMSLINPDELRMEGFRALVFYP